VPSLTARIYTAAVTMRPQRHLRRIRAEWGKPRDCHRKMDAMTVSHRSRLAASRTASSLDDRTWNDLHLDEVFAVVDRTESSLGQHALYHRLRTAPLAADLDDFEALVTRMTADVSARERGQIALAHLQDLNGYDLWWLAQPDAVETRAWYVVFPVLAGAVLLALVLTSLWPALWPVLAATFGLNVFVHYATDHRLDAAAGAFRQVAPVIATAQSLAFIDQDDVFPMVGGMRSHLPGLVRLKALARWVSGNPFMLPLESSWLAIAVNDLVTVVWAYLNLGFLLDANVVYFGARELRARSTALLGVMATIGDIDAAISVASFRTGMAVWTRPRFREPGAPVVLSDLRHPLVSDAVPNSVSLSPPHGVLVTGSNMSGKSTFLRTIGVNVVLAQTIHTCLASRYEAPVFDVRSCIGRSDDLVAGKSYYLVEVEAVLALVRASEGETPHLFLFDELFRGTNTAERIGAAEAVLTALIVQGSHFKNHLVLAATHDGELVDLLRGTYVAYHFADTLGPEGLVFEYRLQPGPATTRNAIALLELHGASSELVRRALARANALDRLRHAGGG
jgi:hypothetical protein